MSNSINFSPNQSSNFPYPLSFTNKNQTERIYLQVFAGAGGSYKIAASLYLNIFGGFINWKVDRIFKKIYVGNFGENPEQTISSNVKLLGDMSFDSTLKWHAFITEKSSSKNLDLSYLGETLIIKIWKR